MWLGDDSDLDEMEEGRGGMEMEERLTEIDDRRRRRNDADI
jgi:hypothetical protein